MANGKLKLLSMLTAAAFVAGCKLNVISPPGGTVTGANDFTCAGGTVCEVTISEIDYTDTFTATPNPGSGLEFVKWQKAARFFCGDTTDPCTVAMPDDAGAAAAIVSLFATAYIMPVYNDVGFDNDVDGTRDELDEDDDNDNVLDIDDVCPLQQGFTTSGCAVSCPCVVNYPNQLTGVLSDFSSTDLEPTYGHCSDGMTYYAAEDPVVGLSSIVSFQIPPSLGSCQISRSIQPNDPVAPPSVDFTYESPPLAPAQLASCQAHLNRVITIDPSGVCNGVDNR